MEVREEHVLGGLCASAREKGKVNVNLLRRREGSPNPTFVRTEKKVWSFSWDFLSTSTGFLLLNQIPNRIHRL